MSDSTPNRGRLFYRVLAVSAAGTGTIGLFLPLLPTVPLLLVALWAAARGSPDLHERLRSDPRWGASIQAWERERAVPRRAKWIAALVMAGSWLVLWAFDFPTLVLVLLGLLFATLIAFLATRPLPGASSPRAQARMCSR